MTVSGKPHIHWVDGRWEVNPNAARLALVGKANVWAWKRWKGDVQWVAKVCE